MDSIINSQPTNQDVMNSVQEVKTSLGEVLEVMNAFATKMEERTHRMERTMTTLATKDFVVEQNDKLRGDIIATMRKGDKKLGTLVDVLHEKKVIDDADVKRVVSMEPFPQLSV